MKDSNQPTTVRIPRKMHQRMRAIAQRKKWRIDYIYERAVEDYIDKGKFEGKPEAAR